MTRRSTRDAALVALSVSALLVPACRGPVSRAERTAPEAYPFGATKAPVHDVQVFREGTRLRMTNTTARDFPGGRLWVNQRFGRDIDGFGAGESLDLDLYDFVDEFGEKFRAGGFFATNDPDKVVLVQLETPADAGSEMHGFVIVRNEIN